MHGHLTILVFDGENECSINLLVLSTYSLERAPFSLQPSYIHFQSSPMVASYFEPKGMINLPVSAPLSIGKVHICIEIF
jgi:hypothetical protein